MKRMENQPSDVRLTACRSTSTESKEDDCFEAAEGMAHDEEREENDDSPDKDNNVHEAGVPVYENENPTDKENLR